MNVDVQDKRRCSLRVVAWDKTLGQDLHSSVTLETRYILATNIPGIFFKVWSEKEYAEATFAQRLHLSQLLTEEGCSEYNAKLSRQSTVPRKAATFTQIHTNISVGFRTESRCT